MAAADALAMSDRAHLVEEDPARKEAAPVTPRSRKLRQPAAFLVLLGVLVVLCTCLRLKSTQRTVTETARDLEDTYMGTQTCYRFVGAICDVENCDSMTGSVCEDSKCVCEASCAGADNRCHATVGNRLVATEFTLTNVNYPRYSIYFQDVSPFGQLKTTDQYSSLNAGKDKFALYRMPGAASETRFLLGSVSDTNQVAALSPTIEDPLDKLGLFAWDLSEAKSPAELSLSVCYDGKKAAVMLGNKDGTQWAYIRDGSWLVYGTPANMTQGGDAALWRPSPAFTADQIIMLPNC